MSSMKLINIILNIISLQLISEILKNPFPTPKEHATRTSALQRPVSACCLGEFYVYCDNHTTQIQQVVGLYITVIFVL
jgi:hypothetical protein